MKTNFLFSIIAGAYLLYLAYSIVTDAAFSFTEPLKVGPVILFLVVGVLLVIRGIKTYMKQKDDAE